MASKLITFTVLVSFAVAHGAKLSTSENTEIVPTEREGRTLEVPIIGLVIWKFTKIVCSVVSNMLKFVGWKTAAVTLIATVAVNAALWAYNNLFSVALTMAIVGFCKITDKCHPNHFPLGLVEVGENLYYAAKNLKSGTSLYDNSI